MLTTVGKLLVNDALPAGLRSDTRVLDKKALSELLHEVSLQHPDEYREIVRRLGEIGREAAQSTGGYSFGLRHLRQTAPAAAARVRLQEKIEKTLDNAALTEKQKQERIIAAADELRATEVKEIFEQSLAEGNPLAKQILGASRGGPAGLASLRGSDLLYVDHRDNVIPIPVLRSYSQGLSPAEYWSAAYGARKGVVDTKLATADAGFLAKQLAQIAHRLVVVGPDAEKEPDTLRGLPVDVDDPDNDGALLAAPVGGYKRNTVLTPKILADLKNRGTRRVLVRTVIASPLADGVYGRDVGLREFSRLPVTGETVGLTAAQALGEPLSQSMLSSKHSGGVRGATAKSVSGFEFINSLIQIPKTFKGGAVHAELDGRVSRVEDAPAGGKYVVIDGQNHWVSADMVLRVKPGDTVEAGDVLSEGIPNPALIVRHKGIGEGRRYFIKTFKEAMNSCGLKAHRRNVELLARGLINHVRLTQERDDGVPDDVVSYSQLESNYKPRQDFRLIPPKGAVGQYLERPYLHHAIGARVKPSMLKDLEEFGIDQIAVHPDPPPFQPEMIRGMANLQHDPDWVTRMFGSGLKKGLLSAVHRGGTSTVEGTSFVPGLARGKGFGQAGILGAAEAKP